MGRFFMALGAVAVVAVACGGITNDNMDGGTTAPPEYSTCSAPGQCILATKTCCGRCGTPTLDDMIALAYDKDSAYRTSVCMGNMTCPGCAGIEDPNLNAVCRSTKCVAIDLRTDTMSACTSDSDCMLRAGNGCCESCTGPADLIAVSKAGAAELRANLCHPDDGPCPKCAVIYPPGYGARCDPQTKHCAVAQVLDAGTD